MKKIIVSALAIIMAMSTLLFTGCSSELTPAELESYYLVTVNGGTGGGNYYGGSLVMAEPTIPDGEQFMYWEQNGDILSSSAEYAFYVEKDTTITAVFSDEVDGVGLETTAVSVTGVVDSTGTYFETMLDGHTSGFGTGGYLVGGNATVATVETVSGEKDFIGWVDVTDLAEGGVNTAVMGTDEVFTFEVEKETKLAPKYDVVFERMATPGPKTITGGSSMSLDVNYYYAHETLADYSFFGDSGPTQGAANMTQENIDEYFTGFGLEMTQHGSNWYCDGYPTADQYVPNKTTKDSTLHDRVSMLMYENPFHPGSGTCSKYAFREEALAIKYTIYASDEDGDDEELGVFFASYRSNGNTSPSGLGIHFDATEILTTAAEIECQWPNPCNYLLSSESEFETTLGGALPDYQKSGTTYYIASSLIAVQDSSYENADGEAVYYIPSLENDRVSVTPNF